MPSHMVGHPPNDETEEARGRRAFERLLFEVKPAVERALVAAWDDELARAQTGDPAVAAVLGAARDLSLRGGKRQRAALVALGYLGSTGAGGWEPALPVAVALELLQAYFLIHDDWMDQDDLRRGGPAVHAALRKTQGSEHLAACGAILAGDYCAALAMRQLRRAEPRAAWGRVLAAFADLQLDALLGQQLDVLSATVAPEEVYRLKTASYTVFGPLWLGALCAGASESDREAWRAVAEPLGIAFQLRDDQIGAFGSSVETGKPSGSDLRAGKRTVLVGLGLALGSESQVAALRRAWGRHDATDVEVSLATEALIASGARERVEARITELSAQAEGAARSLRLGRPEICLALVGAVRLLTERRS